LILKIFITKHLHLLSAIACVVFFQTCANNQVNSLLGRYVNNAEENALHYIDLFDDGTFVHYYSNDTIQTAEKAHWKLIEEKNGAKVFFSKWKTYGPYQEYGCSNCAWSVLLKDGELYFSKVLRNEMNFIKS
jgi:hypothetical protein